ncbi:type II CRISPR-associated endonuclease Cas1 [Ruoffia sp. FAM 26255]|uniref:type II CRISPR-associated endonuclease Cas1 n=1 Tax=Ruoffia sp. FAM 26255 TaxID=3259519 RepID=UPI003883C1D1
MGWRTVIVNTHSKLSYKNNHLVFKSSRANENIHLSEIDVLLLETTDITITTMLMKRLVDENILVIFCDDKRLPSSMVHAYYGRHDSSLQLNKQLDWNEESKSTIWTHIISQKILNQAQFLDYMTFTEKSNSLIQLHSTLKPFDPSNREGHSARIYFNTLFGNDFSRQLDNDINAGLDYGYTLLMSMFAREIVRSGCMTQFGLKRSNQFNDFNLASDFMEPFRILVDQIVYRSKNKPFYGIKRDLLDIFTTSYGYNNKNMFLTNIVSDYTRKLIKVMNGESEKVPEFRI